MKHSYLKAIDWLQGIQVIILFLFYAVQTLERPRWHPWDRMGRAKQCSTGGSFGRASLGQVLCCQKLCQQQRSCSAACLHGLLHAITPSALGWHATRRGMLSATFTHAPPYLWEHPEQVEHARLSTPQIPAMSAAAAGTPQKLQLPRCCRRRAGEPPAATDIGERLCSYSMTSAKKVAIKLNLTLAVNPCNAIFS